MTMIWQPEHAKRFPSVVKHGVWEQSHQILDRGDVHWELVNEVLAVMRDLAHEGRTMLIVTHEMRFARDVSDSVVFLHQGQVEEQGTPEKVFGDPDSPRVRDFMASHTK